MPALSTLAVFVAALLHPQPSLFISAFLPQVVDVARGALAAGCADIGGCWGGGGTLRAASPSGRG